MITRGGLLAVFFVTGALSLPLVAQRQSADWPQWRGPNRDGVVSAPASPQAWPEQLAQKWKVEVGLGYATPLLIGNRLYQFSRLGDRETMSALDADTGKVLWQTGHTAHFEMQANTRQHGPGPKSTPAFANGRLYAIGMTGVVTAYDAATGKQIWQKPGSSLMPTFTTHAFSPIVDRGLVIFHVGGNDQGALTAYDLNTGDVKWSWNGDGPGYGSPIVADFGGTRQVVTITQTKLVGIDAASGALLWERPFASPNVTNSITPVLHGRTIIVSSNGPPTMAVTVSRRNNQWVAETLWENQDIPLRMSDPVVAGDLLFGMTTRNSGQYFGVDATTGKTLWTSEGRQGAHAAIARSGDVLLSLEDDGELVVVRSSRTAFEPIRRYKVADTATWTPAVYSGNRVYVKDVSSLALWTVN